MALRLFSSFRTNFALKTMPSAIQNLSSETSSFCFETHAYEKHSTPINSHRRLSSATNPFLSRTKELTLQNLFSSSIRQFHAQTSPLLFRITDSLLGEPLKKKKKIDPMQIKLKEDRIKGKVQRAIDRLSRFAGKLKPIDEFEVPRKLIKERQARTRTLEPLSFEESENRARLSREWLKYKTDENWRQMEAIWKVQNSQEKALNELRKESEELYQAAIATDPDMIPMVSPIVTSTPPIANYEAPDGNHTDVTKTFEYEVDLQKVLDANAYYQNSKWSQKKQKEEDYESDSDDEKSKKKKK